MLKLFLLLYKFQVVVLVLVVDTKFPSLCDRFNIGMHITHSLIKTKNILNNCLSVMSLNAFTQKSVLTYGSSMNDVSFIGEGGYRFCDDSI